MSEFQLTDAAYREKTSALLATVEAQLDRWLQDDVIDIDGRRTGGVLEMKFPDGSQLVLNQQAPLQEIWLAARSGGYHFAWDGAHWRCTRTQRDLGAVLSEAASAQGGRPLVFAL